MFWVTQLTGERLFEPSAAKKLFRKIMHIKPYAKLRPTIPVEKEAH